MLNCMLPHTSIMGYMTKSAASNMMCSILFLQFAQLTRRPIRDRIPPIEWSIMWQLI